MLDDATAKETCDLLRAVAEPTRCRILAELAQGRRTVTQLTVLVDRSFQAISMHLGILREAGLVKDVKDGRFSVYQLNDSKFVTSEGGLMLEFGWARLEIGQYPATIPFEPQPTEEKVA